MKWILFALVLGILFAAALGCRTPVKTYKLQTSCPDVWAEKPTQQVSLTVEWRQ